ncbi:MAG: GntR family transcriptional regulator [Candidatus Magnetoglobus multicellularis str. Araruama]|uniref:GntR family transcriptional regulator n=1 Tax=Candidatus Magnetoglobus multicellularis str. Araruama TaxID=890399 RepID=A0A1V1P3K3_9BACT|nr:MAG: GntR family transcriptional regulator [Candidatus Magnetoglobus multicellularis str. Araruama]
MKPLNKLSQQEIQNLKQTLKKRYESFQSQNLSLNMTRGVPSTEQLDLSNDLLTCVSENHYRTENGVDCRNYGGIDGIPEAKHLFASYMGVSTDEIIVAGNSSLTLMHDTFMRAMVKGVMKDSPPWCRQEKIRFICPAPGYDRHFSICNYLNIEMITVEMTDQGLNMNEIESLVANDETIKGIWCVPKYSNPTGVTYSDDIVERLANMKTRALDFRIFLDNAYAVHDHTDNPDTLMPVLDACKRAGNPDRVYMFGSTAKITFAGAGVAVLAASKNNIDWLRGQMVFQSIGPDKVNQLRHVLFFKDMDGIYQLMQQHARILKPKFQAVQTTLEKELGPLDIAQWTHPKGGYFISVNTPPRCAKQVVDMAKKAGVMFTPAGATYPYQKDPLDRNIRLAPSFPSVADIEKAMAILSVCIQRVALEKHN